MKNVVLSFDDGRSDFYDVAYPILKANNLCATLNVITDYIDTKQKYGVDEAISSYITTKQIHEIMNNGIEIASHSSSHTNNINDIKKSILFLKEQYNIEKIGFASPNSAVCNKNIEIYKDLDVEYIRSGNVVKRDGLFHMFLYILFMTTKSKRIFFLYNKRNIYNYKQKDDFYKSISINKIVNINHIKYIIDKMKDGQSCILMFHSILDESDEKYSNTLWCNKKSDFEELCQFLKSHSVNVITNMDLKRSG